MAKCELCGRECKSEIKIEAYNHSAIICGKCAVDKEIITDPEIVKIICKAEGFEEGKACILCSRLLTINARKGEYLCQRYDVPLKEHDVQKNYCECFERV